MKKEYLLITTIGLVLFGYALDYFAGPVRITLENPVVLLREPHLSTYPLTLVSIFAKALALSIGVPLLLSAVSRNFFLKAIILFVIGGLFELYAIQQLATRGSITPIEWTVAFSYAGVGLFLLTVIYLFLGIFTKAKSFVYGPESKKSEEKESEFK